MRMLSVSWISIGRVCIYCSVRLNYKGLSRVADDFQAKAVGNNPAFEGVSDEPRDKYTVSDRRVCEIGIKQMSEVWDAWDEFCMSVLGEGGPTGAIAKVWLDKKFVNGAWKDFVEGVNLMNGIIQSEGSDEAYDAYYAYLDKMYNGVK